MYVEIVYEIQNIIFNIETKFTDLEKLLAEHTADKVPVSRRKDKWPVWKMDKTFEQRFPKIYIHMVNEHMKKNTHYYLSKKPRFKLQWGTTHIH